jgi:hypothetical protein
MSEMQLEQINRRRAQNENKNYLSIEAAEDIYGQTLKPMLTIASPFCRFFKYGAEKEGY